MSVSLPTSFFASNEEAWSECENEVNIVFDYVNK